MRQPCFSLQKAEVVNNRQERMALQSAEWASMASLAGNVLPLPDRVPQDMRYGINASIPKHATVVEALQLLSVTTKYLIDHFVQSCKRSTQRTHHALQQSREKMVRALARFDRTTLHLLSETDFEQVRT